MSERVRPSAPVFAKVLLYFVLALLYLPLVVMVVGAFLKQDNDQLVPTFDWFLAVFNDQDLIGSLQNSFFVAFISSLSATFIGAMAAIAIYRSQFIGKKVLQTLSMISLIFPEIVFALSLLSLFYVLRMSLGLHSVIIAHITFCLSYVMMTVGARLSTFDRSIEDAAQDLGANELTVLTKVIVPMLKPALMSSFVLSFLLSFDDFLITFFVNGVGSDTLPVKLYAAMKMGLSPKLNALATMMLIISGVLLTFLFRSSSIRDVLKSNEN